MLIITIIQKFNKKIVECNNGAKEEAFRDLLFNTFSDLQPQMTKIIQIFRKVIYINFLEKKQSQKNMS